MLQTLIAYTNTRKDFIVIQKFMSHFTRNKRHYMKLQFRAFSNVKLIPISSANTVFHRFHAHFYRQTLFNRTIFIRAISVMRAFNVGITRPPPSLCFCVCPLLNDNCFIFGCINGISYKHTIKGNMPHICFSMVFSIRCLLLTNRKRFDCNLEEIKRWLIVLTCCNVLFLLFSRFQNVVVEFIDPNI